MISNYGVRCVQILDIAKNTQYVCFDRCGLYRRYRLLSVRIGHIEFVSNEFKS